MQPLIKSSIGYLNAYINVSTLSYPQIHRRAYGTIGGLLSSLPQKIYGEGIRKSPVGARQFLRGIFTH